MDKAFKGYNVFNSQWATYNQTYNGVNPPNPYIIGNSNGVELSKGNNNIVRIDSRDPYAVEHLNNGYGTLQTKLGTSMGVLR